MALIFPPSPTNGQTYQSGSSPIYTFNGIVWELSSANTGIANLNAYTASIKTALQLTGSNATMLGNLNVQGTQTALNQASLQITDKFIRVASGSLSSAQSNGAGLIIDGANVTMSWDSSNGKLTFNTELSASKYYGDGSGLTGINSYTNSDNLAYLNTKGVISGSSQIIGILSSVNTYTGSNDTKWTTLQNVTSSLISATASYETKGRSIVSGSSQLTSSYDSRYTLSGSVQPLPNGTVSGSSQVVNILASLNSYTSSNDTTNTNQNNRLGSIESVTSSYETKGRSIVSGSSQLTSSFDIRYALSGSGGTIPGGTISGSSQLTSSYDGRYTQTSSFNTLTSSFNSFTASAQSVTTGSNSFNGTQTITGSLIVTTGSFVGSLITANTSSLYLTSGSNLYVQNNGVVQITGSLVISGSSYVNLLTPALLIGTGSGDEGGEIQLAKAITNTTLTGNAVTIDVYRDRVRTFEQGGNARGVYIDLSKAPDGVAGEIFWKASGFVNAGTYVSLDNIKATVTTTGNRGLSLAAVSTTFTALYAGTYDVSGGAGGSSSNGSVSITTTPTTSLFGWNFAGAGDLVTIVLTDTTNSRAYRITLQIGGSYLNNFIMIERLH